MGEVKDAAYWSQDWAEITSQSDPMTKWKHGEKFQNYVLAKELMNRHGALDKPSRIFVPLAGDAAFVPYAHRLGHSVVAAEYVPEAVERMKKRFNEEIAGAPQPTTQVTFEREGEIDGGIIKWVSNDGRAVIYQGDIFKVTEEPGAFDMIFDKDAYGALPPSVRKDFVDCLVPLLKPGGYVLLEGKNKSADAQIDLVTHGPPFHISDDAVHDTYMTHGLQLLEKVPSFFALTNPLWKEVVYIMKKPA